MERARPVAVAKGDTVEEELDLGKIHWYSAEVDVLDMALAVYSDTVADKAPYWGVVDMVVVVAEMALVVVVAAAVEGKADHIENMAEVLLRPSLRCRLDHEEDSVEVDDCLCYFGDSQKWDLSRTKASVQGRTHRVQACGNQSPGKRRQ